MPEYKKLFDKNKLWVESKKATNSLYFEELSKTHQPDYLLIACCDSRVAPLQMMGAEPGEVFIHRNIGNIVKHDDTNGMAALEYAIHHLNVKHIVVCGHYNCGAVLAASNSTNIPVIDPWIQPIRDLISLKEKELQVIRDESSRHKLLVELHVKNQCKSIMTSPPFKKAMDNKNAPTVHGWIYDLESGNLIDLDLNS